ncbi:MAG: DUF4179 domain-containing protein, partial [Bacillota bacterium]|nr:DUF4179 domain-containing protein [Bacillota bacterium]
SMYKKIGYYDSFKDFSQYIGISKESSGYKFTLDKIVADEDNIIVAMRVYKPGLNKDNDNYGKVIGNINLRAEIPFFLGLTGGSMESRKLNDDTSLIVLQEETSPTKHLPKRFNMRLFVDVNQHTEARFNLSVSREKITDSTTQKKDLGTLSVGNNHKINIDQLKTTPINTTITYSTDKHTPTSEIFGFYLYDDKGRIYPWRSDGTDSNGYHKSILDSIDKDAKKIYITPFLQNPPTQQDADKLRSLDFFNKTFSLDTTRKFDFGEMGEINVYKIEKGKTTIRIYYTFKGVNSVLNKSNPIMLYEKGEAIAYINGANAITNFKLYNPDTNNKSSYCAEFLDVDPNKEYVYSVKPYSLSSTIDGSTLEVNLK